jgi:hypothetical protein
VGSDIRIDLDYLYNLVENLYGEAIENDRINGVVDDDLSETYSEHCKKIERIVETLEKRISDMSRLDYTRKGEMSPVQNNLLLQMLSVFDDLKTLVATTTPTTMYPLKSTIGNMSLEKGLRNHHNFMTDFNVNKTAYTGKKDVGIAATGQKSLMGITQYYSNLYTSEENMAFEFSFTVHDDWRQYKDVKGNIITFGETFKNYVLPGQKLNGQTLQTLETNKVIVKELDKNNNHTGYYFYTNPNDNYRTYRIKEGDTLDITSATDINSAFISAATDNAKEMLLDSLNASQEILPAFVFGVSKGVPLDLLTTMFTDELVPFLLDKAKGDLFEAIPAVSSMLSLISNDTKRADLAEEFTKMKELLGLSFESEEDRKGFVDGVIQKLNTYGIFFDGASQMRSIGGTLSVNGGVEVYNGASIEWMMRIQNTINSIKPKTAPEFSIEEFLFADKNRRLEMCDIYRGDRAFTILDILTSVPHYASMCKVPYLYKIAVESTSKDMEILHRFFKNKAEQNVFTT